AGRSSHVRRDRVQARMETLLLPTLPASPPTRIDHAGETPLPLSLRTEAHRRVMKGTGVHRSHSRPSRAWAYGNVFTLQVHTVTQTPVEKETAPGKGTYRNEKVRER